MNALCLIPAILKIIFSSRRGLTRLQKLITFILDIAAILCQTSVLLIFRFYPEFDAKTGGKEVKVTEKSDMFILELALAVGLISVSYWQNFAEVRYTNVRLSRFLQEQISQFRKFNSTIYVCVSPVKIVLTFVFAYLMLPDEVQMQFGNIGKPINTSSLFLKSPKLNHNQFKVWNIYLYFCFTLFSIFTCESFSM